MALFALRDVSLGFRGPALLDGVDLTIEPGERICLLGRNGTGKSSLLRLIHGEIEPDRGEVIRQQGLVSSLLPQGVPQDIRGTVFDEVAQGLGPRAQVLAEYHATAHRLATESGEELRSRLDRLQHTLEIDGGWSLHQEVEAVLSRLSLPPDAETSTLSAGMKRRVLMARALVRKPDILLLDEPTNHLDIEAIGWLEEFLLRYSGTLLFVTHDRALVRRLATRIIELDRGRLSSWTCDYETYRQRRAADLAAEAKQWAEFDKRLDQEETWIRTGIQARRTRNEGRVRALQKMREMRRARREQPSTAHMEITAGARSGRLVIEAKNATFAYDPRTIIDNLTTMIMRGDRVGLIGPNGSGKTTLLRLLLGELTPQSGSLRHGTNLEVAYFDQLHAQLDESKTVRDSVCDGADSVTINGKNRHVMGYLEDFLFTSEQAVGPVQWLSGGERKRLLLARLFTKPSNLLVMDEPTNDLDVETLELLEDLLIDYPGSLLLVSHDREFLNNVVTSTLVLEGEGRVKEYAGGYDDWLRQRPMEPEPRPEPAAPPRTERPTAARPKRLTYQQQRELESLPGQLETLEAELAELHHTMADPAFYRRPAAELVQAKARLQDLEARVAAAYQRWETLESMVDS